MAFQPVTDTAEIVVKYNMSLEAMFNVFHAEKVGGYTLADLQLLADTVDAVIGTNWLAIQTQDAVYQETLVRGLASINDQEAVSSTSAGPGLVVSEALPGNVTLSIKKGSGQTGRSARGRIYWIGLPTVDLSTNENQILALKRDDIVQAVDTMRNAIEGTVWTPVIVSRFTGGLKRAAGETFNWTTVTAVNDNIDSNRKRLTR